jgi:hypothetical protein
MVYLASFYFLEISPGYSKVLHCLTYLPVITIILGTWYFIDYLLAPTSFLAWVVAVIVACSIGGCLVGLLFFGLRERVDNEMRRQ